MSKYLVLLFIITITSATIINVPGQYPTIQQGLNAAQNGDTVLVAAGTYPENIVWPNTDGIHLMSASGAAATVVDGNAASRVINFPNSSFSQSTVITGFTIQNGSAERGAGLYVYGSPYIIGNVIEHNVAQGTSTWVYGGGMYLDGNGAPRIEANTFRGNSCQGEYWNHGGGLYIDDGVSPLIIGNVFEYDSTVGGYWNYGAGIYCDQNSSPDIRHNVIHDCVATDGDRGYGVAIHAYGDCPAYILSNLIYGNTAQSGTWNYGAGLQINNMAIVYNNTIVNNRCIGGNSNRGGGIHVYDSTCTIANNIVVNNSAVQGGGIAGSSSAHATLINNDVWNNTGGNYYNITPGTNDISVDPLLVTGPMGDYYLSQTAAGQAQTSPCVDYGFTTAESLELHTFTTRTDTIYDSGTVDLGYHYPTQPWIGIKEFFVPVSPIDVYLQLQVSPTCSRNIFTVTVTCATITQLSLAVYDRTGRQTAVLFNGTHEKGTNTYELHTCDNTAFPCGIYFIVASSPTYGYLSRKIVIAR